MPDLPAGEGRHPAGDEPLWNESWYFDFTDAAGELGGYVRFGVYPNLGVTWYWAYFVREGQPLLAVRDHEAPLPKGEVLEIRTDGLWSAVTCETPHDHWSIGLEAFAVALDDPADALSHERGDRVALGFDLEWEAAGPAYDYPGVSRYEVPCEVHGEILVGDESINFAGPGQRDHSWGVRDWWTFPWCWTAGRLEDGTRFHASAPRIENVRYEPGYVMPAGGTIEPQFAFAWDVEVGEGGLPASSSMELGPLSLTCTPVLHAPVLMPAPDGRAGRLPRALCHFTEADGRTGVGWTEWNQPPPPPSP